MGTRIRIHIHGLFKIIGYLKLEIQAMFVDSICYEFELTHDKRKEYVIHRDKESGVMIDPAIIGAIKLHYETFKNLDSNGILLIHMYRMSCRETSTVEYKNQTRCWMSHLHKLD